MLDENICRTVVVTFAVALQQKLLKQALSLFEIARVEPLGVIDRSEKLASPVPASGLSQGLRRAEVGDKRACQVTVSLQLLPVPV